MGNAYPVNSDAPEFTPELWSKVDEKGNATPVSANCIAYALSGSNSDGSNNVRDEAIPQLGYAQGHLSIPTADYLRNEEKTIEDNLPPGVIWVGKGTVVTEKNGNQRAFAVPENKPGYYVDGVYLNADVARDMAVYHFVRQNREGSWSDKMAGDPVEIAMPPSKDGGYMPLPEHYVGLHFAGYTYVPKGGVDAGVIKPLIQDMLNRKENNEDVCQGSNIVFDHFIKEPIVYGREWGLEQIDDIAKTMEKYIVTEPLLERFSPFNTFNECRKKYLDTHQK